MTTFRKFLPVAISEEQTSFLITASLTSAALVVAFASASSLEFLLLHTIAVGALGGFMHEFAQSGGKILFIKKYEDGIYLGSLSGMILGIIAGLLVIHSDIQQQPNIEPLPAQSRIEHVAQKRAINLDTSLKIFFASLGLKGITEATTGNTVKGKSGS